MSLIDIKETGRIAEAVSEMRKNWIDRAAARYVEKGCLKRVGIEAATILLDEAGVSLLSDPVTEADKDMADWSTHQ